MKLGYLISTHIRLSAAFFLRSYGWANRRRSEGVLFLTDQIAFDVFASEHYRSGYSGNEAMALSIQILVGVGVGVTTTFKTYSTEAVFTKR